MDQGSWSVLENLTVLGNWLLLAIQLRSRVAEYLRRDVPVDLPTLWLAGPFAQVFPAARVLLPDALPALCVVVLPPAFVALPPFQLSIELLLRARVAPLFRVPVVLHVHGLIVLHVRELTALLSHALPVLAVHVVARLLYQRVVLRLLFQLQSC